MSQQGEVQPLRPHYRDDFAAKIAAGKRIIEAHKERIKRLEAQIRRTGATPVR